MPRIHPRSLKTLHARISALAVVLMVVAVSAGSLLLYDTYRRVEEALADRVTLWLRGTLAEQAREARATAESRATSEAARDLVRSPAAPALQQRFANEHVQVIQRRGFARLELLDGQRHPVFVWQSRESDPPGAPLPDALFTQLDTAESLGGYLKWGTQVLRVGGAALRDGAGHPAGYLVIGAPVSPDYLERMHQAIALPMRVTLAPATDSAPSHLAVADSFVVIEPLRDVLGAPLATVRAPVDRSDQKRRMFWSFAILALVLVTGALITWSVWYYGRRLLLEPLDHMVRDVQAMRDAKAFTPLEERLPVLEWEVLRTAFNETARALSEFQRRYRDVFDRAVDPMFLIDPSNGRVIDANPATTALTGVPAATMIDAVLPEALAPHGPGQRAIRWQRPDGATLTWGLAASEVSFEGGVWWLAAYRDLTAREAVAHAQKMEAVGLLAGGIAHDFNNLLGAVLTGVTAARALAGTTHPVLSVLDGIEHAGTRAAQLTRQLLTFSRHDPLRLAPVDIAEAVGTVRAICERTFDRRIVFDVSVDDALPNVLGDAGEIEQALLNLCINARDAMPSGGELRIAATRRTLDDAAARALGVPQEGTYVELMVADSGTGMSDDVKVRIFEPFFTTKPPGKGTGLGLTIVHGLMRQLGGSIAVDSARGTGTKIRLLLPALPDVEGDRPAARGAASPALPEAATAPLREGQRPFVLLVDDEQTLREMLRIVLELSGFEVAEAVDGEQGLERARAAGERLHAVLLDMQLPGAMSGVETLAQLRAFAPSVPVLLCTGFLREDELARARMLGVDDVLLKPLDLRALVDRLHGLAAPRAGAH